MSDNVKDGFLLVAAIDFGTTFSGYGYSFKASPEEIRVNKNWGDVVGFQSYKTPTCVLTNHDGDFEDFGIDAEDQYDDKKHLLFRHFKMLLLKSDQISENSEITALNGTKRSALEIFAYALQYLKNHLLESLEKASLSKPDVELIRWVITVPAIWDDEAKQFMRRAAFKAGLIKNEDDSNLVIALEPEAASICCRRTQMASFDQAQDVSFGPSIKYMIIDCGGGTVDITLHELGTANKVKELLRASGGPWGGIEVDYNFVKLLERVFSAQFIERFRRENRREWLELLLSFERKKRKPKGTVQLPVTYGMNELFLETFPGKSLKEYLEQDSVKGVSFSRGYMKIEMEYVHKLFAPVIESIILHIRKLLQNSKVSDIKYILMVGGFSDCVLLQNAVRKAFENNQTKVLIPEEVSLAVIKGAILYGHNPTEIYSRIARYTYGHATCEDYDESIHDAKHRIVEGDEVLCDNIFSAFVTQDDEIPKGTVASEQIMPNTIEQRLIRVCILKLDGKPKQPIQYTDDPKIKVLGTVQVEVPSDVKDRTMEVSFTFGGTEIKVDVKSNATGKTTTSHVDFQHDH